MPAGALLIAVVTEPVALGLIRSPGEMGADVVVGSTQPSGAATLSSSQAALAQQLPLLGPEGAGGNCGEH